MNIKLFIHKQSIFIFKLPWASGMLGGLEPPEVGSIPTGDTQTYKLFYPIIIYETFIYGF